MVTHVYMLLCCKLWISAFFFFVFFPIEKRLETEKVKTPKLYVFSCQYWMGHSRKYPHPLYGRHLKISEFRRRTTAVFAGFQTLLFHSLKEFLNFAKLWMVFLDFRSKFTKFCGNPWISSQAHWAFTTGFPMSSMGCVWICSATAQYRAVAIIWNSRDSWRSRSLLKAKFRVPSYIIGPIPENDNSEFFLTWDCHWVQSDTQSLDQQTRIDRRLLRTLTHTCLNKCWYEPVALFLGHRCLIGVHNSKVLTTFKVTHWSGRKIWKLCHLFITEGHNKDCFSRPI